MSLDNRSNVIYEPESLTTTNDSETFRHKVSPIPTHNYIPIYNPSKNLNFFF